MKKTMELCPDTKVVTTGDPPVKDTVIQWIGFIGENLHEGKILHETIDFLIVYGAFRLKLFPRKPKSIDIQLYFMVNHYI